MPIAIPTRQPASNANASGSTASGPFISELVIPGHPEHVRAARAFTALALCAHSRDDEGIAGLLVSELVTNALQHSDSGKPGGMVTILVAITPDEIHVAVTDDGGPGEPTLQTAVDNEGAESGRGLCLLERLSATWGHHRRGRHLTTWFELSISQAPCPSQLPSAPDDHQRERKPVSLTCSCGYEAGNPTDLADHLGEVFIPSDDIAFDGQAHAEAAREGDRPGSLIQTCICGFASDGALDEHFRRVFTPDDGIGLDGKRHVLEPAG
jgi:anti-sigma regulatory factor (Ser/Thr protein kinase)